MAERIAHSRATLETDHFHNTSPHSGNDTNSTFHKKCKSEEDGKSEETTSQGFSGYDKGMFKSFKDGDGHTGNKQLPLASNAVTNDTDNVTGATQGRKRMLPGNNIEEIKEEDENNESYDARKHIENYESLNDVPEVKLHKNVVSEGDFELGFGGKHNGK